MGNVWSAKQKSRSIWKVRVIWNIRPLPQLFWSVCHVDDAVVARLWCILLSWAITNPRRIEERSRSVGWELSRIVLSFYEKWGIAGKQALRCARADSTIYYRRAKDLLRQGRSVRCHVHWCTHRERLKCKRGAWAATAVFRLCSLWVGIVGLAPLAPRNTRVK